MDIRAGVIAGVVITIVFAFLVARSAIRTIQLARRMTFYSLRRERMGSGWQLMGLALLLVAFSGWLAFYGEPVAYSYFPPSPTASPTPGPTAVATSTTIPGTALPALTPTITDTPPVTETATLTTTPQLPAAVLGLFQSDVTPNPEAVFSPLQFTTSCKDLTSFQAATVFRNPTHYLCGVFTYDKMVPGAQWTAIWFRDGKLVSGCMETHPWDGGVGGYGYADCELPADEWLPGNYTVQIFVGEEWKVVGEFLLQGEAPTATPTRSPTPTPSATPTATKTPTEGP